MVRSSAPDATVVTHLSTLVARARARASRVPTFSWAGIGRFFARTGWDEDATWFSYGLGWIAIDHQNADGNGFAFYRDGEWLTKGLVGYGFADADGTPSDDLPRTEALVTITDLGDGRTQMTIASTFPDAAAMEQILAMGMEQGITEAVGQIDALLADTSTSRS